MFRMRGELLGFAFTEQAGSCLAIGRLASFTTHTLTSPGGTTTGSVEAEIVREFS